MNKTFLDEMMEGSILELNNTNILDMVNHPPHYTKNKFETIDVIEDWKLSYHLGNAVKYISRCEYKGNKIEDLKKAIWYIKREIEKGIKNNDSNQMTIDDF